SLSSPRKHIPGIRTFLPDLGSSICLAECRCRRPRSQPTMISMSPLSAYPFRERILKVHLLTCQSTSRKQAERCSLNDLSRTDYRREPQRVRTSRTMRIDVRRRTTYDK